MTCTDAPAAVPRHNLLALALLLAAGSLAAIGCRTSTNSPPAPATLSTSDVSKTKCFSSSDVNLVAITPTALANLVEEAEAKLNVRVPLPTPIGVVDQIATSLVDSSNDAGSEFIIQFNGPTRSNPSVSVTFTRSPICWRILEGVIPEELELGGTDVKLYDFAPFGPTGLQGKKAVLRSGALFIEVDSLWSADHLPPPDDQRDLLRRWVLAVVQSAH